ncbi:hypothetical protein [Clostridium sp.]|uniref:hypothetical protein n=1 Tax=Clostridium sp. TaxID=1506 RepID=UPI00260BC09B|nr:hypothetical protein [Clostridium sp.]
MKELLISQITPIITTAIVSVLVFIIKKIGDAVIELLVTKKKEVELRIISSGHEKELNTAKEVWNIIEEKFRITENCTSVLGSKVNEFDKLLLSKIPGLTQDDLDYLRQAVAGEVNKYKNIESTQSVAFINNTDSSETTSIATQCATSDSNINANSTNLTTSLNTKTNNTNIAAIPNVNLNSKDITASSNVKVDNPDNKQLLGAPVNAISAAAPH